MGFERLKESDISDIPFVKHKVSESGDFFTITEYSRHGGASTIRKLSKDHYVYLPDGEIREYQHKAKTRDESVQSLRRTMARIRDIVNCNVRRDNVDCCRWLTLTYRDRTVKGETGAKQVLRDYGNFWKSMCRWCVKRKMKKRAEYIAVLEPQNDGVWHLHVLIIWKHKAPFIPNREVEKMWGRGFTKMQRIPHANMGGYLSAYLTDASMEELKDGDIKDLSNREIVTKKVDGVEKRFVKGARLFYYPSGINIIRHSQGIEYPTEYDVNVSQMEAIQKTGVLTYQFTGKFKDEETGFELIVTKRVYMKGSNEGLLPETVPIAA